MAGRPQQGHDAADRDGWGGCGAGSPSWDSLLDAAWTARESAHAPYSGFRVGAAVLLENGSIAPGCNIENASYPVSLCAERTALAAAVAMHGARPGQIMAVAIATEAQEPTPPCGACRQALSEFAAGRAVPVIMANRSERRVRFLGDLLPDAFGAP